ncbi:MAG: alkaline serine protease, partial [Colwelliaceae bacterium]|nr:alkaline serine protease [Colwelliaceae bacterium]
MKVSKFAGSLVAVAISTVLSAQAADDRFIIQVDNSKKGVVKALAKQLGGNVKVDGNGFIAASFAGKDLESVKGLLNNPHIQLIEVDQKRELMSAYSDDAG